MSHKNSKKKDKKTVSVHLYKGILEITRSGMGFVVVPNLERDILIRPGDFNTALNGDTVRVKIIKKNADGKRMQGEVKEVVDRRKQSEFVGQVEINAQFCFLYSRNRKADARHLFAYR